MEQIEPGTLAIQLPLMQYLAGIDHPWQGILDGLESPPIMSNASLVVMCLYVLRVLSMRAPEFPNQLAIARTSCPRITVDA